MSSSGSDRAGGEGINGPAEEAAEAMLWPEEGAGTALSAAAGADPASGPSRRSFLKAAALGIGATSPFWRSLIPMSAFAHDTSSLNCTANDVRIIGPGVIVNEPCGCSGTFDARVRFTVENNAAAARHCIALHLCEAQLSNGATFGGFDVQLGTIEGKTTRTVEVTIPGYPCGQGLICFGGAGSQPDGSFLKGESCPTSCCTVISWDVGQPKTPSECAASALDPIPSKCRRQQVCIQGRGGATLDCDTGLAGVQRDCTVVCGQGTTLRLCTTSAAGLGPFTFELFRGSISPANRVGSAVVSQGPCVNFNTGAITADTTFIGRVTDRDGCATTDSVILRTSAPVASINVSGNANCDGVLTLRAVVPGFTGCTVNWSVGGNPLTANADGSLTYGPVLDGLCKTVRADVDCGGCTTFATKTIAQCVTTTLDCT